MKTKRIIVGKVKINRKTGTVEEPKGKPFGYVCPFCQDGINNNQATVHTRYGLAHAICNMEIHKRIN